MRIFTYANVHFEDWDWSNSTGEPGHDGQVRGIGGSETQQTELVWRLAQRGHDVTCYAPVPWEGERVWRGSKWTHYRNADFTQPGIWIIYRNPLVLDNFSSPHPEQKIWLCAQDESYPTWNEERIEKLDKFIALCQTHAHFTALRTPGLKGKIDVCPNGLKMDLIREVEAGAIPERNPRKLIYASSPDRGLDPLLKIFKRAREWVHDLELHIFYGFDNIDKLMALYPHMSFYKDLKASIMGAAAQPGVHFRGRVSQQELYREWLSCGIFCHPSMFTETGFITCLEAQALGAIPITNPIWAAGEYVMHGTFIDGNPYTDQLVQARYAGEIFRLASNPELQEQIRKPMMADARLRFNWERIVDRYEAWICDFDRHPMTICQFAFQLKHAQGKILNIGCAGDPADLKRKGATNVDVATEDPIHQRPTKADILADCRTLTLAPIYDSVVYGDILEHFPPDEVPGVLKHGKACLAPGGRIVITVPDDRRPVDQQHAGGDGSHLYADRVSAYHDHRVPEAMILEWLRLAGLKPVVLQKLDYTHFMGHGVVAVVDEEAPVSEPEIVEEVAAC